MPCLLDSVGKDSVDSVIGLDRRGPPLPQGKGEAVGGRSSFQLGKHGQLPIETLPLYFRKLPKSLEENSVFPFQPPWAREGGGNISSCMEAGFVASEMSSFGGFVVMACHHALELFEIPDLFD